MDESRFDTLVGDFYRAATGDISWDRALDGVQAAFGARTAVLHTADPTTGQILAMNHGGPSMHDGMLDYVREYHRVDLRRAAILETLPASLGQWWHCHEHLRDEQIAASPFYRDFLPAYDTRYLATVGFPISEHVATFLALELPAARGVLNADERELARRLGVHLSDALRAWQRLRALLAQALAGHGLLNHFPYPMWLIGEDRQISFENPAARHEADLASRVLRRGQYLALSRNRVDQQLTEQLHTLMRKGQGASSVLDLRADSSDAPTWLHLCALEPGAVMGVFGLQPQVLATLFDPQQVSALDPFALARMFKLTPTEAQVAARLAEGLAAEQIAARHGTTLATVRSQIGQVIAKLGAKRSVDVVRMLRQGEALWSRAGDAAR